MRHRLKFSQSSYIRMRGREWRGEKNRERKRDLGQDTQRERAGGKRGLEKDPRGESRE